MVRYAGWALVALSTLFLLMDGGMKLIGAAVSVEATTQLGFSPAQVPILGALLVLSALLYAVPATSVLGAILVTAYLGGAVAIDVRQGTPLASHVLFGVYVGILVWAGLYLKTPALRRVFPFVAKERGGPSHRLTPDNDGSTTADPLRRPPPRTQIRHGEEAQQGPA